MESSQKEVQDSDGPVQYLLRELESINVLHK